MKTMFVTLGLLATVFSVTTICSPVAADGALAVGMTSNANDGFTYGWSRNHETPSEGREMALKNCRKPGGTPEASAQCRIVGVFKNECFAVATDPEPGTPGNGWAIASTKVQAERRALANCKAAAGSGRSEYCVIDDSNCDGDAQ